MAGDRVILSIPVKTPTASAEPITAPAPASKALSSRKMPIICFLVAPMTVYFEISEIFSLSLIINSRTITATASANTATPASTTGADSASACSFIYEPPVFATSIVEYSGSSEMRFIRPFTSAPSLAFT